MMKVLRLVLGFHQLSFLGGGLARGSIDTPPPQLKAGPPLCALDGKGARNACAQRGAGALQEASVAGQTESSGPILDEQMARMWSQQLTREPVS